MLTCLPASRSEQRETVHEGVNKYCVTTSTEGMPLTQRKLCYSPPKSDVNSINVSPFKNRHAGQSAILACTGPTLQEYVHTASDKAGKHVFVIGVNGVIFTELAQKHGLDYFFLQDTGRAGQVSSGTAFYKRVEEYTNFRPRIQNFYGLFRTNHIGPSDEECEAAGALRYESEYPACNDLVPLVADIGQYTFGGSCSVAMSALQFILYAGFTRVKLVGCDVTFAYSSDTRQVKGQTSVNQPLLRMWKTVPEFIARYYPHVTIDVVRPVGLKGIDFNITLSFVE